MTAPLLARGTQRSGERPGQVRFRNSASNPGVRAFAMSKLSARLAVFVSLGFLVGCDHATKGVASAELGAGSVRELVRGVVDLRYVENTDVAFNLLRWVPETIRRPGLLFFGAVAVVALVLLLIRARGQPRMRRWALVLVTAGAVGNYLDRLVRGYVVDFVHVEHWPVFNVADAYVTVGVLLMAIGFLCRRPSDAPPRREAG
jgi:signal peptidase II